MARAPDPRIEEAKAMYLKGRKLIEIAKDLDLPEGTVRRWKSTHKWESERSDKNSERSVKRKRNKGPRKKPKVADEVRQVTDNPDLTDKQRLFCILYIRCFNAAKAYQKAYECSYETALTNGPALLGNTRVKAEIEGLKLHRLNREMLDEHDIFQKYIDIAFADITDFVEFGQEQVGVKEHTEVDGTLISEIKQGTNGISIKLLDRMKALQWLSDHMDLATEEQKSRIALLNAKIENERLQKESDNGSKVVDDWIAGIMGEDTEEDGADERQ